MEAVTWEAPGAGSWELDLAHCLGSMTPITRHVHARAMTEGMREMFAEFGMPADTLEARYVNGYMYSRLRPLMGADRPATRLPPKPLLRLVFAVHPEFRRRRRQAEKMLAERPWREVIRHWDEHERGEFEAENLALQDVDPQALDDAGLVRHFDDVVAAAQRGFHRHFVLHGYDLGPIGLLLRACAGWGITVTEVVPALQGASPSTSEPARILSALRAAVASSGRQPTTLDELRAISPEVAAELDRYLRYRGWRVFSRYDVDGQTLGELPGVVLASVLTGKDVDTSQTKAQQAADGVRARLPVGARSEFDDLLTEARFAMDLRDDNGPTTAEWRLGLLRRAMREIGSRLAGRGALATTDDVFELEPGEVAPLLLEGRGPSAADLSARAERRRHLSSLTPPERLGPAEPAPPLDVLPAAQATLIATVQMVIGQLARVAHAEPLRGTGVGTEDYRGRVRRAETPEEAMALVEPGDVLVVPFTTPAYNAVLPLVGALVTTQGGPLSHAAVLARELDIPAVVGVAGALDLLADRAEVEVDPVAGEVRLVGAGTSSARA